MFARSLSEEFPRREFLMVLFLLFNTLTWYYIIISIIENIVENLQLKYLEAIVTWAVFCLAVIGFSIAGSILSSRKRRLPFIYVWMIFGILTSLLPTLFTSITMASAIIICLLLGASFGLGMPSCLAYFADISHIENRGSLGGISFLATNLSAVPIAILIGTSDLASNSIISMIWRGLGLVMLFVLKPKEIIQSTEDIKPVTFLSIFRYRAFVLYLIPWFMFCLIDRFEAPILDQVYRFELERSVVAIVGPLAGSISALIGGLLSDRIGRKRVVIYGLTALGLAYAIIGIAPTLLISWYLFVLVDAVSAGMLWVVFILTLWGDLSPKGASEKYYAVGNIPFFITWGVLQLFSAHYLTLIPTYAAFSLASFFLFLAVLPLLYAPETLPERKIELRRLRGYMEKARKLRENHQETSD